jgi:hypothetical protein
MEKVNTTQKRELLLLLKTLADEQRLTMLALMNGGQERTVTEMAGLFDLSEPTISHHVGKLHGAGLLRLRMAGNQRFYTVNEIGLAKFKAYVAEIDQLPTEAPRKASDESWLDALDTMSAADKKVLREYTENGQITQFPAKNAKWLVMLRWLATRFEPDVRYTEKQVNAILSPLHEDYATMRRSLVEYGFMRREQGGGDYWLTPTDETDRERRLRHER